VTETEPFGHARPRTPPRTPPRSIDEGAPVSTAIVLFTRDLRVHDHPALAAAVRTADEVVPLFVLDDDILGSRYASPNRVGFLLESLADLRGQLRELGGELVVRRGDVADEVAAITREVGADRLHLSADVSRYAAARGAALQDLGAAEGIDVVEHPGVAVVPAGGLTPASSDHFAVFTPYWRRWAEAEHRPLAPTPARVVSPGGLLAGDLPRWEELVSGERSPAVIAGGESEGRARLETWLDGPITAYEDGRDLLGEDGTSRLSAYLHLGCVSPLEVAARIDRRDPGHEAFLRQLCWRDFNQQLLAARPWLPERDLRSRGDRWRDDGDAIEAWKEGRTGYPVVDAAMRQLRQEGWMHNRARMLVASFLTKHLHVDWRVGAWHFMDWLVDGDLANNFAGWQWTAGTGLDSRPNRVFNPITQSRRFDPEGRYLRRYLPELEGLDDATIHAPWEAEGTLLGGGVGDYPPPLVDHREARERFLEARGT
jgi:deoxyribodipyrimidine photo-lyase